MDRDQLRHYFAHDLKWGASHQARLVFEFLCSAADHAAGGVLLDAGAGHQRYKPFFQHSLYVAQEHPEAGVKNKGIAVYDILCDVMTIPLRDACVHAVLSTSSLEHMRYPEPFFRSALRVLVPGGSLHIHVPFVYSEHEIPYDFQRPTRYGLRRWYEDAGFTRVEIRPASSSIYPAIYFLKEAVKEEAAHIAHRKKTKTPVRDRLAISPPMLKLVQAATGLFTGFLTALYDRGPYSNTKFPIGWLAVGYKPGTYVKPTSIYPSVAGFLSQNSQLAA